MNENSTIELCNIAIYDAHDIGERIKKEAYTHDITIKELSTRAGIGENSIQQMTKYGKMPRVDTLARICDVLNISIDALLERPAPTPTPAPSNLDTAISTVAAAANLSADYVRGVLRLPPSCDSTNDDI
jgi:DNA-binding Xre family transcriptional regulator